MPTDPAAHMSAKEVAAYAEARRRSDECKESGATELDLSNLGLTSLPPEIGQLTALTRLFAYENQLVTLPPEIGQLAELQEL